MNTEIITTSSVTMNLKKFDNPALNEATERIAKIYNDAAKYASEKNRAIAKELGAIAESRMYETAGYKSVADYANDIFGIARQNAYALANAGKVYNSKEASPILKAMSPSKLAEIAALSPEKISKGIEDGSISSDKTQKELREYVESVKVVDAKPEVLKKYTVKMCASILPDDVRNECSNPRTESDWDAYIGEFFEKTTGSATLEILDIAKGNNYGADAKATIKRRLYVNPYMSLVVEFYEEKPKAKPKKTKKAGPVHKFTREQLEQMLSQMAKEEAGVE